LPNPAGRGLIYAMLNALPMQRRKGYRKGQSTIEYLMTYGFAFFVIVLVLALLFGLVLPALKAPETCQFSQPGFSCSTKAHAIFNDAGAVSLALQLDNQQGKEITVEKVACIQMSPGNVERSFAESNGVGPSESALKSGASMELLVPCVGEDGSALDLAAGSDFQGSFALVYKYKNDLPTAPSRLAVATLSGAIQEG